MLTHAPGGSLSIPTSLPHNVVAHCPFGEYVTYREVRQRRAPSLKERRIAFQKVSTESDHTHYTPSRH
jgi:hypothetical protein